MMEELWIEIMKNILITSADKKLSLTKKIIKDVKGTSADRKVYTCDMSPESVADIVESDGCFKVPICTSEDYVETMWSLCLGHNIGQIIPMTEKEFIILSANKELFAKYGIKIEQSLDFCPAESTENTDFIQKKRTNVQKAAEMWHIICRY